MRRYRQEETEELFIESLGFEGKAVAKKDNLVYFVSGAVAGDTVLAKLKKKKKNFVEAEVKEVLIPSPHRIQAPCPHFGYCGGCRWQHLQYQEQTRWKKQHVQDAFERIAKIPFGILHDTIACLEQYGYRNKMEFSFAPRWLTPEEMQSGQEFDTSFALGLHAPQRFDKVLDIEHCLLQGDIGNAILAMVSAEARKQGISVYNTFAHAGCLRNLVVRTARNGADVMVVLVTSSLQDKQEHEFIAWCAEQLPLQLPAITTVVHAVTDSKATVATGETTVLYGSGFIEEELLGVRFRVSPFSFFQTNTSQAEKLFTLALDYAAPTSEAIVWDLYCGAGSITLPLAKRVRRAIGIEISESSIADAKANAERNSIHNVEFHCLDMSRAVREGLTAGLPSPDVIITDPPRAGMNADVVTELLRLSAPKIVYISCNPTTQARDCALLAEKYRVAEVVPVDMFPNTYHVESVALLIRNDL